MTPPPLLRKRGDEDTSVKRERECGRGFYLVCWLLSLIFDAVCFTTGFFFCCYQYSYYCHWANFLISGLLLNTISMFWCLQQKLTLFVLHHTFILLQNYLYDMGVDIHMSSYRTIPIQINFVGCPENKGNDIE